VSYKYLVSTVNRNVVYSLLTAVVVLLLGIVTLLGVAYYRHQRLADETTDLRRSMTQQEGQIKNLQERLEDCDTIVQPPIDSSWTARPSPQTNRRQVTWPMQ